MSTLTSMPGPGINKTMQPNYNSESLIKMVFADPATVFNLPDPEKLAESYQHAKPYGHMVVEDFFQQDVLKQLQSELVDEAVNFRKFFGDGMQTNKTISTGDDVPPMISLIAAKFASPEMLRYLEKLTGLKRLIPDPYYNTAYGYYHIVGTGGILASHVDHSRHSSLKVPHVLNLVVYLSPDWDEKDGGSLYLYDASGKKIEQQFVCKANRAVIFACTPTAFHGVAPISKEARRRRHSLYFAYYSVDALPSFGVEAFPSSGSTTSNLDASTNYGTYFIVPFRDLFLPKNWGHLRTRLIYVANLLLPPILVRGLRSLVRKFF